MANPSKMPRITVDIGKEKKLSLIKYSTERGQSISYIFRKLLGKLLKGEIVL